MSERNWTDAQQTAITAGDSDILVSAAAGSGKTAVLTERIIRKLTKENGSDIRRLLVVTFSVAAAEELKSRIAAALTEAAARDPGNRALARQLVLLSGAHISTIHSFCLDIVRQNHEKLGLSADSTIADDAQDNLLMMQSADAVIEAYYAGLPGYDDIHDFPAFADNFIGLQDKALSEMLIDLYTRTEVYPEGIGFVKNAAALYDEVIKGNFFGSVWGKKVLAQISEALDYYRNIIDRFLNEYGDEPSLKNYAAAYREDASVLNGIGDAVRKKEYGVLRARFSSLSFVKMERKGKNAPGISKFFKDIRDEMTDTFNSLREEYFCITEEQIVKAAEESRDFANKLFLFLAAFKKRYTEEKKKRQLITYRDMQRYACMLLCDEKGEPTDIARHLSESFDEICIDEYQDVDPVQDRIFSAIAKGTKRFMVGDIKQSIYGFRGSDPTLFAGYRKSAAVHTVFLENNFRCDRTVIDYVNHLCKNLFPAVGSTVPYRKEDALVFSKKESADIPVEVCLVQKPKEDRGKSPAEAEYVASRIEQMIREGIQPRDICILLRSPGKGADSIGRFFENALAARHIPFSGKGKGNLFASPEIRLVLALLNVIDNPNRDIFLAGVLKSPIYNVTLSELITVREYCPDGSLYQALVRYTEETGFEKGKFFLEKLKLYREAAGKPTDALLWQVYCDTHIFALTDPNGKALFQRENLYRLYDYSRSFESGSFRGLYNFIRYLNSLNDAGKTVETGDTPGSENAVSILTMHKSKGLEFPVVFVCNTDHGFNDSDTGKHILTDRELGISLKLSDPTGLASLKTPFCSAAANAMLRASADEEVRILYVALTRAVRHLIVTGTVSNGTELIESCDWHRTVGGHAPLSYLSHRNHLRFLLTAGGDFLTPEIISPPALPVPDTENREETAPVAGEAGDERRIAELTEEYRQRFSFCYPDADTASLPAKLSVSELYPAILDEFSDAGSLSGDAVKPEVPAFVTEKKATGADVGTATHQFMQFCDYTRLNKIGVEREIACLTEKQFLDETTASLIDRPAIERFLASDLYPMLRDAVSLRRELRFNIRLPAAAFTLEKERKAELSDRFILVQGIMDCVFFDRDGRMTLLDYKTDAVPPDLSGDEKGFIDLLIKRHSGQLTYYRAACRRLYRRSPDRVLLYSFALGRTVDLPVGDIL